MAVFGDLGEITEEVYFTFFAHSIMNYGLYLLITFDIFWMDYYKELNF